jgi:FkbM family methyltransferase
MLLFDIGANVGSWTLANLEGNSIVAVEASPTTYSKLVQNVAGKNVNALNYAVTNSGESTVPFYISGIAVLSTLDKRWLVDARSRFGVHSPCNMHSSNTEIIVNTVTLDALVATYGVPDLLKIDVEGAENIVIRSLTRRANLLCFEWASEWNPETFECIDYLVSLGYTTFHIQREDHYTYRPSQFEHTADSLKAYLTCMRPMVDWGMIWCFF